MRPHDFPFVPVMALILGAFALASCMAPPPRPAGVQRAPSQAHALAPTANIITPYGSSISDAGDAASLAQQKVVRVGLLVPLSGRNAPLGKAFQDAAALSLFDKYARLRLRDQLVRVELLPKDTGDTPERAAAAAQEAIADGAEFVIGPLFADAVSAAAPVARAKNISVLSFSNTRAQASPGTYMFGFSPAEQADRVVTHALTNGYSKVAVLAPKSPLGDMVIAAAEAAADRQGFKLAAKATYLTQGAGMDQALNALATAGKPPEFDAILIAEGGGTLDTILRGLSARGVKPSTVKFLGTGLWDDVALLQRVNLDSAWFASSLPPLTEAFETRFRTTYGYEPPRVASLAYDAVALAVTLATSGREFSAVNLTSSAGFSGPANGIFRLKADGTTQRGLAVMQVKGSMMQVISPPPKGF
jgi:branched-chain amino acid transport system substrate-binding protein